MDPYEYLLTKLGLKICPVSDISYMPYFNPQTLSALSWDFFEDGQVLGVWYGETKKEDACRYVVKRLTKDFDRFLNVYFPLCEYSDHFKTVMKQLHQMLAGFPDDLESTEHVDLLLAVNGLNIGA